MESTLDVFSILFCIFMNLLIFYIFGLVVYIIRNIRRRKYQISPEKITSVLQQWEKFQTLFVGYKDDTIPNHCFALLFMCRTYLFNLIIAHLFDHPLLQAILIVILSILMIIYLIWKRPFKSKLVLCQSITDEITLLLVNICVMILASLDASGGGNFSTRENLGDIIIIANIAICLSSNIYLLAFLCVGVQGAYNAAKSHKGRGVVSWFASLLAPFESGGMDLEVNDAERRRVSHLPKLKNLHLLKPISNDSTSIETTNVKFVRTFEEDFNQKENQILSCSSVQDQEPYSQSTTKGCFPNETLEQEQPLSPDYLPKKASKFKKFVQLNPSSQAEAESPRSSRAEKPEREKVFDFEQKVFGFEKEELNNSKQTE